MAQSKRKALTTEIGNWADDSSDDNSDVGSNDSDGLQHETKAVKREETDIEEMKQAPSQKFNQRGGPKKFRDPQERMNKNGNFALYYCNDDCFKMDCIIKSKAPFYFKI